MFNNITKPSDLEKLTWNYYELSENNKYWEYTYENDKYFLREGDFKYINNKLIKLNSKTLYGRMNDENEVFKYINKLIFEKKNLGYLFIKT